VHVLIDKEYSYILIRKAQDGDEASVNEFGVFIHKLVTSMLKWKQFCGYTGEWRASMYSEAALKCFKAIPKYDPKRLSKRGVTCTPYSYMSRVASMAFLQAIKDQRKRRDRDNSLIKLAWKMHGSGKVVTQSMNKHDRREFG